MSARHGTTSGFTAHYDRGEEPCESCREAKRKYDIRWRSSPERTMRNRLRARAQGWARGQLAAAHPEEYAALYRAAVVDLFAKHGLQPPTERKP